MIRHNLALAGLARACGIAAVVLACALPASAQTVTTADIQRLQDQAYDVSGDVSRLRTANSDAAARLQPELDDLRDEIVYLKVKMRKEGSVSRSEYTDVRDRLDALRTRAGGSARADARTDTPGWRTNSDATGTGGSVRGGVSGGVAGGVGDDRSRQDPGVRGGSTAIPAGQDLDVRLDAELSSATAQVEQHFQATTVADLYRGNEVLIPAGSVVRGVVSSVTKATRMERKGSLTVSFDQIIVRGRTYPMRGTVTQALESEGIKGETGRIGTSAGVGAIIGGILGGLKGAVLGAVIAGGGIVAATEGKDVTIPAGTVLRVRLDNPPQVR